MYDAVAYQYQDWEYEDLFLYDIIGIANDNSDLAVFYIYCNLAGNTVESVWFESYNTPINYESASGQVVHKIANSVIDVTLPGINVIPSAISSDVKIDGADIFFSSGNGWLLYQNTNYTITTWSTVDCSDCGEGGWYELHSMFSSAATEQCFGILYLMFNNQNSVMLQYGLCFPTLEQLETTYNASWNGNLWK